MGRLMAVALCVAGAGCAHGMAGSGRVIREARDLAPFDGVDAHGGVHVLVETGPRAVVVEADDNLMALVETRVDDGRLWVGLRPHSNVWDSNIRVHVSTPSIRHLGATGGSDIRAEVHGSDALEIEAHGGADVTVSGIDASQVDASGTGGAVLDLAGSVEKLRLDISGGTHVRASRLEARIVRVRGSGGCTAEVRASESVRGRLSGGCDMKLIGRASSRVRTSGGSSVDWED